MAIRVSPAEFARDLAARGRSMPHVVAMGLRAGAERGRVTLIRRTPTNTGQMRSSWRVQESAGGLALENDAPHAGVVEMGARPHPVNEEGMRALARWARLKLGLGPDEAERAAQAIAAKISREGQRPTYFVREAMDDLRDDAKREVDRAIAAQAGRPAR